MGRPKKTAPAEIEPEEISQEFPEEEEFGEDEETEEEAEEAPARSANMSKASVCRAALAEGIETTEEAVNFARVRYGMEIKPTDFTLYKSKEKTKQGAAVEPAKRGRKPKAADPAHAPAKVEGYLAPPPKPKGGELDLLDALSAMKPLIAQYGPDKVKQMVDLLG